ncbi:hypothetical protein [Candidatus Mycolicibacterium alkanivorans]|uniref:Uncharacterized protein n=1 Tax=Candidatus Mycolicibacterium alkanivorans TaxID=2954114 RepID=A0ABS9YTR9_9MYCO|nr:hypothetical protein [Candidatus Mycolicibacterium alkanivorans]MCI4674609.1 hypothetical protein [Candidatus Mycolicibacterium alkanivorans]
MTNNTILVIGSTGKTGKGVANESFRLGDFTPQNGVAHPRLSQVCGVSATCARRGRVSDAKSIAPARSAIREAPG